MRSNKVQSMYCKICKDAGKAENVYGSHWPKDAEGKLICPTLKDQECRYCHKPGHTTKYCKELEKKKKMDLKEENEREKAIRAQLYESTQKASNKQEIKTMFAAAFESDSDDEEKKMNNKRTRNQALKANKNMPKKEAKCAVASLVVVTPLKQEETLLKEELFPSLNSCKLASKLLAKKTESTSLKISYADAVSFIPQLETVSDDNLVSSKQTQPNQTQPNQTQPNQTQIKNFTIKDCFTGKNGLCWADAWSDDEE